MSDPRYRNGVHKSTRNPHIIPDTPTAHGWTRVGKGFNNCDIFQLDRARMRAILPEEKNDTGDSWVVFIDREPWATFAGPLDQITREVKAELGLEIPFQGEGITPLAEIAEAGL